MINSTLRLLLLHSRLPAVAAAALMMVACGQTSPLSSPTAPTGSLSGTLSAEGNGDLAAAASTGDTFSALKKGKPVVADDDKHDDDKDKDKDKDERHDEGVGGGNNGRGNGVLSGFVSAVGTNALTVGGVNVVVNASTRIRHGNRTLTVGDIHVGDHVQVRGHRDGNNLVATEIKVEDTGNDNDEDEDDRVEDLKGTVSGISAASGCPVLTFTLNTTPATTVKTDVSTVFDDVTCATLANGAIVEVDGIRQADGSILAKKIEAEAGPDEVEGTISELTGTCPALTFKVRGITVTTSASTTFSGVACAALANGTAVEVEGTKQANGSIAAASVKRD